MAKPKKKKPRRALDKPPTISHYHAAWEDHLFLNMVLDNIKPAWDTDIASKGFIEQILGKAEKSGLDILPYEVDTQEFPCVIIAQPYKASKLFQTLPTWIHNFCPNINEATETIKDMPVAEATFHTLSHHDGSRNRDFILGTVFGFKECDIKYYLETRSSNQVMRGYHEDRFNVNHVICPECASKLYQDSFRASPTKE